jgi:hypothetical protein
MGRGQLELFWEVLHSGFGPCAAVLLTAKTTVPQLDCPVTSQLCSWLCQLHRVNRPLLASVFSSGEREDGSVSSS